MTIRTTAKIRLHGVNDNTNNSQNKVTRCKRQYEQQPK